MRLSHGPKQAEIRRDYAPLPHPPIRTRSRIFSSCLEGLHITYHLQPRPSTLPPFTPTPCRLDPQMKVKLPQECLRWLTFPSQMVALSPKMAHGHPRIRRKKSSTTTSV